MTPLELVLSHYQLPVDPRTGLQIVPYELQANAINELAPLPKVGVYAEVGTGKTIMGTCIALFKHIMGGNQTVATMPPVLLTMWYRWLSRIGGIKSITLYRGTPKQRRQMDLSAQFILMSMGVFKKDFDYLLEYFAERPVTQMVDEATSVKNGGVTSKSSQNYRCTQAFTAEKDLIALTGTPLSSPADGYGYVKLVSPTVYRSVRHFEALHVGERDFFDNVTKWTELELLSANLMLNSIRILKREALPDLREPRYIPIPYELDEPHKRLYKKLAEEQLLLLEDGGKIDATVKSKLYNCLQQIVCNPGHFSGDPDMKSAAHEILDSLVDQIGVGKDGGGKLLIAANYKMTNRGLLQYLQPYGAVAIYSEVSDKMKQRAEERFREDPSCGICIVNPDAGGYGLDGFQHVCNNVLFMEAPVQPRGFHQVVGRLDRDGQQYEVLVHMPCAQGTIQVKLHDALLSKDELVNNVQGGWKDLREAIYGIS